HDLGRDELLAGARFAFDEDVDVALRDLVEEAEEPAHRHARSDERSEGREHRDDVLFLRRAGADPDDRVADREETALREVRVADTNAVELGSVHRAGVTEPPD